MKNFKKIVVSTILVAALASCDFNFNSGTSEQALPANEANTRAMLAAMFNMTNMTEGSFELQLDVDGKVDLVNEYDVIGQDFEGYYNGGELQASVNVKLSDLWGNDPKAAVTVDVDQFSMYGHRQLGTEPIDVELEFDIEDESAAAYYHDEHVYVDISNSPTLVDLLSDMTGGDFSELLTFGAFVGPFISEIPDLTDESAEFLPDSEEVDALLDELVPIMMMMPNSAVTSVGNELRFVYTLTQSDLPDLVRQFILMMFEIEEDELDSEDEEHLDLMVAEALEFVDLELFRLEVRIDTVRNILNYFSVAVDLTISQVWEITDWIQNPITLDWEDVIVGEEISIIDVDVELILQILKFNEPVAITLPNFDDYEIIIEDQPD